MKTRNFLAIMILGGLLFSSCNSDEEVTIPMPEVTMSELGYENSRIGYAGTDLHIEADIIAEGKINRVILEIHPEGEHAGRINDEGEWEVTVEYEEFEGLKNATFHKHVDIPASAAIGEYHVHFEVVDMEGQQTVIEEELLVQEPNDETNPSVSITDAPTADAVFNMGETISISGTVSDDIALGGMYIGLVRVDQNLEDGEVNAMNTITILHTHDFDSQDEHAFNSNIEVGALQDKNVTPKDISGDIAWQTADYYILVKCKDAFGGNWAFSAHYPIKINIE